MFSAKTWEAFFLSIAGFYLRFKLVFKQKECDGCVLSESCGECLCSPWKLLIFCSTGIYTYWKHLNMSRTPVRHHKPQPPKDPRKDKISEGGNLIHLAFILMVFMICLLPAVKLHWAQELHLKWPYSWSVGASLYFAGDRADILYKLGGCCLTIYVKMVPESRSEFKMCQWGCTPQNCN